MEEDKKLTAEEQKSVEEIVERLFSDLEIEGTFAVEPGEDALHINIETKDTGMVIGYHGETLDALQLVVALAVSKKVGRFIRLSIDVDGYKKNREDYLHKLAIQTKEKALAENAEQTLMSLKPWERRIVHLYLQNDDQVESESSGEGKDRVLVVRPKA